jgi:hypothetical protein
VTDVEALFQPGERITHHEYGQGVVLDPARDGYLRAFFGVGERRVPVASLRRELTRTERILRAVDGGAERSRKACWLSPLLADDADAVDVLGDDFDGGLGLLLANGGDLKGLLLDGGIPFGLHVARALDPAEADQGNGQSSDGTASGTATESGSWRLPDALAVLGLPPCGQPAAQPSVGGQRAVFALEEAPAQQFGARPGVVLRIEFLYQRGLAERAAADVVGKTHQRVVLVLGQRHGHALLQRTLELLHIGERPGQRLRRRGGVAQLHSGGGAEADGRHIALDRDHRAVGVALVQYDADQRGGRQRQRG